MSNIALARCLLGLLGDRGLLSSVTANVSHVSGLLDGALDGGPALTDGRGHILTVGNGISASSELTDSLLDKGALGEASSHEHSVDDEKDPRSLLEEDSRAKKTEPQKDFENGNECHGSVVVVLNEVANGVGQCGALLLTGGRDRLGLKSGQEVGASVGGNVEDRVDGKGQDSKRNLSGEEPGKGHCCELVRLGLLT